MTDDPNSPSARASLRAERRTRRKSFRLAQRESVFEMVASGYDLEVIAATLEISVATVQAPSSDRAIAERRLDAPRALRPAADRAAQQGAEGGRRPARNGDIKAVAPLLRIVAALDPIMGSPRPARRRKPRSRLSPCPLRRSRSPTPPRPSAASRRPAKWREFGRTRLTGGRRAPFCWRERVSRG